MTEKAPAFASCLTPILCVRNFPEAINYYTKKLLFRVLWEWGKPPTFGCVGLGKVEIFFCLNGQGAPGMWMSLFMDDVDAYYRKIRRTNADIVRPPKDEPWGCREMQVRDPNQHVIRFSQGIPEREPKLPIKRVSLAARVEKRLAQLLRELARHKKMTLGEMLEETFLHTFEQVPEGGVASPHTSQTMAHIAELKKKHGIDYETHASYRFTEKPRRSRKSRVGRLA